MGATQLGTQTDTRPSGGAAVETGSLVDRAAQMAYGADGGKGLRPAYTPASDGAVRYPDGYLRQTPVQPYRTPEDYYRRRNMKFLGIGFLVVLVAAALWVLLRSGIFGHLF